VTAGSIVVEAPAQPHCSALVTPSCHCTAWMNSETGEPDDGPCVQYYVAKFPSPASIQDGTATDSHNRLRKLAVMARFTIMRCKNNVEHEDDLLKLLPGLYTMMDTDCAAVRMRTTEMWVAAFSVLGVRCGCSQRCRLLCAASSLVFAGHSVIAHAGAGCSRTWSPCPRHRSAS
jgi:hypothetical protein